MQFLVAKACHPLTHQHFQPSTVVLNELLLNFRTLYSG